MIKSFTDSVTAYVAQVEKHVLEKSESLHIENETRLERQFNDLDSVGTEIDKCKMQLEDEDRVNRLFISAIEIGPVIEKLRKKIASIGRQHVVTKYEFQPNKLIKEMVNGSGSFGDVCILPGECFNTDLEKDDDPDTSPTADSKDEPNQHTGNRIFPLSDAECNRNLKINVRTSLSKQSGKKACYTFGCKTMDVYLRWKMALRDTSIFKQVVKKLSIAKKYQLKIAFSNALLIEAPSWATCTEEEALRVVSDVVNAIVEDTKVYSCESINLEGHDSVKVLTEIHQSRLSSNGQLVEAYDGIENKLWVLCHPTRKDHLMNLVEKARQASKMQSNQRSETLNLSYFLHQRLNDKQVKYDFKQTFSSVELTQKKILNADTVLVTLRSETAEALKAAKMWIYDLEYKFASCALKYSDHEGRVSGDLMTEFLNMSFKDEDIKHETNEQFHKVWIWSSSLDQTSLEKLTMKARNIIKIDKVYNSVSLPIGNIGLKKAFQKQRKKYDQFVHIDCKENEVVISGLCYLVDTIQRELDMDTGSNKIGQNQPGSTPITNITAGEKHTDMSEDKSLEPCVIRMDTFTDPKTIQCGHTFCKECIDQQFTYQKKCPTCGKHCKVITGDQPDGNMTDHVYQYKHLPGFENYGTIYITYIFPPGKQQSCHPSPGCSYKGITRTAYLPDNEEGRKILKMLRIAFDRKLTFTIGNSRTTGQEGVITWNDIHHKTDHRSHTQFGYPDPTYLERVKDELAAKGVTEEDI